MRQRSKCIAFFPQVDNQLSQCQLHLSARPLPSYIKFSHMPVLFQGSLIYFGSIYLSLCFYHHEIKRHLLLRRKVMTNLDSILKSRDITLPTKVCLVKAMVFPVVMYGCEIWAVKKAEHRKIDAFELWCWRRLLRVPWTTRRSNQSMLKEISPGC